MTRSGWHREPGRHSLAAQGVKTHCPKKSRRASYKIPSKSRQFTFYEDPGHGWLKVPKSELVRLGIADQISHYSYQRDGWAYLEEDSDAEKFHNAMKERGEEYTFKTSVAGQKMSKIRSYNQYGKSEFVMYVGPEGAPNERRKVYSRVTNKESIEKWADRNGLTFVPDSSKYGGWYKGFFGRTYTVEEF